MIKDYIGERFGDYVLTQLLGEGGFARVYLGEHIKDKPPAAVKILKQPQVHDFINEVRRTVLLHHTHIINILDFGIRKTDDAAFIIMEYAPNGSLQTKYPRGTQVPLHTVISYIQQIAAALQYAHDQNVIHCDVKPENFLLNTANAILLSDFGIATRSSTISAQSTEHVAVVGTYAYMAPEQFKGQRPVVASDQYALAIVVHEWLCGELPFEGKEYIQWAYLHQKVDPPALRDKVPTLPLAVEQVVLKALSKEPRDRFNRIADFATALSATIGPMPLSEIPSYKVSDPIEAFFQEGVKAQARGDVEAAYHIWEQIAATPNASNNIYVASAIKRLEELRPAFIALRVKQAGDAHMHGLWQREIELWENLLTLHNVRTADSITLKPSWSVEQQIRERIEVAKQNMQLAWMYENAMQSVKASDLPSAKTQLGMLWRDAPYYGDPKGLARIIGMQPALNYEQALKIPEQQKERRRNRAILIVLGTFIVAFSGMIAISIGTQQGIGKGILLGLVLGVLAAFFAVINTGLLDR